RLRTPRGADSHFPAGGCSQRLRRPDRTLDARQGRARRSRPSRARPRALHTDRCRALPGPALGPLSPWYRPGNRATHPQKLAHSRHAGEARTTTVSKAGQAKTRELELGQSKSVSKGAGEVPRRRGIARSPLETTRGEMILIPSGFDA